MYVCLENILWHKLYHPDIKSLFYYRMIIFYKVDSGSYLTSSNEHLLIIWIILIFHQLQFIVNSYIMNQISFSWGLQHELLHHKNILRINYWWSNCNMIQSQHPEPFLHETIFTFSLINMCNIWKILNNQSSMSATYINLIPHKFLYYYIYISDEQMNKSF